MVFTLSRSGGTTDALDVNVRLIETRGHFSGSGIHQVSEDLTLTFAAGSDTATLTKTTEDDDKNYGNATIVAAILPGPYFVDLAVIFPPLLGRFGQSSWDDVLVWIQDDDRPTVTIGPVTAEYEEGDLMTVTSFRTGDTTALLWVDAMEETTRRNPAPLQDETTYSELSFGRVMPGDSSTTQPFKATGPVGALGATGRLWLVPDDCPDDSADCGRVNTPHICVDHPGPDDANCSYRAQYMRGSPYEQTFTIYNDFMGVRIEADQASIAEGGAPPSPCTGTEESPTTSPRPSRSGCW